MHGSVPAGPHAIGSGGTVSATFTQDGRCATSSGEAVVDAIPTGDALATASFSQPISLRCPNLTVTNTNDATSSTTTIGHPWNWTLHVANSGPGTATFTNGQTILSDDLPNSHAAYGSVSVTPNAGVAGTINCGIVANNLSCSASGTVTISGSDNGPAGTLDVKFSVTPSAAGAFANPRAGGSCAVDPADAAGEDPTEVNSCSNTVTVGAVTDLSVKDVGNPDPTVVAGSSGGVDNLTHTITLTNNGPDDNAGIAVAVSFAGSGLPSGTTLHSEGPSVGTYDTSTNTWTVPSLANGGSATLQLKFSVTSATADVATVTSVATASVTDPFTVDPNASNNSASVSTTVHQAPRVTVSPTGAFGNQRVGVASSAKTFTITNTGGLPLTITSDAITGTGAGDFSETSENCTSTDVSPSRSCSIMVTFDPTTTGPRGNAQIHIVSNALTSPDDVALSGTGIQPALSASPASPASKSFGDQRVGTTSGAQTFTITNTGTDTLNISTAGLAGSDAGQYVESGDHCSGQAIAPNATCTVDVAFKPTSTGAHNNASLRLTSDAPSSPNDLGLTGTGAGPAVSASPASKSFGDQRVGTTSAAQTFTITNTGSDTLNISTAALAGSDAGQYVESNNHCDRQAIASNGTCTVEVAFKPTSTGDHNNASLDITSDAPSSVDHLSLNGTGTLPALSASPQSKDFGTQVVGSTSPPQTFTITNTGTDKLNISTVALAGADAGQDVASEDDCSGQSLVPANSCTIKVAFKPTSTAAHNSASLDITSDAPSGVDHLALQGTGTAPVPARPTESLIIPPDGASYRLGQLVAARYSCQDAPDAPGLRSCTGSVANSSPIDTSTGGQHAFTVTALSKDGLSSALTHHYTVMAPPIARISTPADNRTFSRGQNVATSFRCVEGAGGPGIKSCEDSNGARGTRGHLDTARLGTFAYTVRATSSDGLTTTATIHYNVLPANTHFRVTHLKIRRTGVATFDVTVPGAGIVNVMESAWKHDEQPRAVGAAASVLLQPLPGRFVFTRAHLAARTGGTFHVRVAPNQRGKRLVAHHRHPVKIRLWVTFAPPNGRQLQIGFYSLLVTK